MRAHEKPNFNLNFDVKGEIRSLKDHRRKPDRKIPRRTSQNLLIATWNLTNFGLQAREASHLEIMAEIIRPFDIVAFQEVADDIDHLNQLLTFLRAKRSRWNAVFTDIAGNQERIGYFYRTSRVQPTGLAAELAMRGYQRARIEIEGIDPEEEPFTGFNRNPYMVEFKAGKFKFSLVNVHLYWSNMSYRQLESKALAKWAASRVKKAGPPHNDLILIGDFNMPHARPGDSIYDELKNYGLTVPKHTTDLVGTNLAGDRHYDELAFFPSRTNEDFGERIGVFDFDNALFSDFWNESKLAGEEEKFFQYVRYYVADHRPLWAEFKR